MIVTVFRSRLREGVREEEEYVALANRINELARTITGYVSHKDFYANDGERASSNLRMKRTTFRFAGSSASRNSSCPEKQRHRLDPRS